MAYESAQSACIDGGATRAWRELEALALPGGALVSVVGESYRQPRLEQTAKLAVKSAPPLPVSVKAANEPDLLWFQAVLVREPNNAHDKNAIKVYSQAGHIGYLSREDAEDFQEVLIAVEEGGSQAGACSAFMRRASNGNWGVVLALSSPENCLSELEES